MDEAVKGLNVRVRNGRWHYRFHFRGREYSGSTGFAGDDSNRSVAEEVAAGRRRELERSGPRIQGRTAVVLGGGATLFREAATEFLTWCKDVEYRGKPSTAERLRVSFVSIMDFFKDARMDAINGAAVEAYKAHRLNVHQVLEITVRHDLHALSLFYRKYARKRGLARVNPVEEVTIPSDRDAVREHPITAEEEKAYFKAARALHERYAKSFEDARANMADLSRLMLDQGMRPEEALAARVEHFHAAAGTLLIAGGKSRAARRTLHLTKASVEILERRASGGVWLFPSDRNPGHHLTKLDCTHDRICREAGVSFVTYDFRHTFATRAIEAGVPVAIVAAILGHSGLRTIHRYVHPSAEAQRAGMEKYEAAKAVGE
jgi:integrase